MDKNINRAPPAKEPVGYWWNDSRINVYEVGGKYYAASGWNGEKYEDSFEVTRRIGNEFFDAAGDCVLSPIYRFEAENLDLDSIEEGTEEWDAAVEIVDYHVE